MALLDGGLLAELSAPGDDVDDPREWLRSVQELLGDLTELDDQITSLRTRQDRPYWKDAPWWLWLALFAQPGIAVLFAMIIGGTFEERLWSALVVFGVPGLLACGLIAGGYGGARWRRRQGRAQLAQAIADRNRVRSYLVDGCTALSARNFVARVGARLLMATADLDWLDGAVSTARRTGKEVLADALEQEATALDAAFQAALVDPPAGWATVGVLADRSSWEARIKGESPA